MEILLGKTKEGRPIPVVIRRGSKFSQVDFSEFDIFKLERGIGFYGPIRSA